MMLDPLAWLTALRETILQTEPEGHLPYGTEAIAEWSALVAALNLALALAVSSASWASILSLPPHVLAVLARANRALHTRRLGAQHAR